MEYLEHCFGHPILYIIISVLVLNDKLCFHHNHFNLQELIAIIIIIIIIESVIPSRNIGCL